MLTAFGTRRNNPQHRYPDYCQSQANRRQYGPEAYIHCTTQASNDHTAAAHPVRHAVVRFEGDVGAQLLEHVVGVHAELVLHLAAAAEAAA